MKLFSQFRSKLALKLFLSYLLIIFISLVVLFVSVEFVIPNAFDRHMSSMMRESGMSGGMGMMTGDTMGNDLYLGFRSAVADALLKAGLLAFMIALGASLLISRKVVFPIQEITKASRYIADGHYDQRVTLPNSAQAGNPDELGQLALSFNQMAENLDQTETMRRQLIGDVSHELRTPLTTIKGSMEGLLDGVLPATPETFENIHREASRLERLVSDLQELSRVESGAVTLVLSPLEISGLIGSVTKHLKPQFSEKKVSLELEISDSLPPVNADQDRLSQVLINLLGNALQYTPEEGKVSLSVHRDEDSIIIRITDTGIGIPPEHLPHLFTRFYRVDKSRSRAGGGSGIGLTIAKSIVESHGGRIWVESGGPGKGSTFTFTLPVVLR